MDQFQSNQSEVDDMKVIQMNFLGDHNIGMFARSTDNFCLVGNPVTEKNSRALENNLKVSVLASSIANTEFIGMFCVANSNGIVLPKIVLDRELQELKSKLKDFDINLYSAKSRFTSIGNLILCNDKGALISKLLSTSEKKSLEDTLGVEVEYGTISGMSVVGSSGVATNKGCLIHRDASEEEIKKVESILKVDSDIGTANFGSPFVGSCIIANSNAAIVGESTSGPEIVRLQETLGFI